jgi:NAD(P)-dependent dehydrogenase (short-subunit alcohol dehydrogenase family)
MGPHRHLGEQRGNHYSARLEEGEFEAHRQVLETSLVGAMYAARFVIPVFRRQGTGTLIDVGSVRPQSGRTGLRTLLCHQQVRAQGLTEALRTEFADDEEIHVCTVLPYARHTMAEPPTKSRSEAAVANGAICEQPFVLAAQQSQFDETRAPAGRHTGWANCDVHTGRPLI